MLVALFGITNDGLNLFVNLVVLFGVVVWIALVAWTFLDARRRIEDPVLVLCATGASLFPFVGTVVYAILRPPEFLEDARERELEIHAAELRLRQLKEASCPNCGHPIERTYLRCPDCRARVKDPCEACRKPIDPRWTICPYCETPQRRAAPVPRREPARRASESEPAAQRSARQKRAQAPRPSGAHPPSKAAPVSHARRAPPHRARLPPPASASRPRAARPLPLRRAARPPATSDPGPPRRRSTTGTAQPSITRESACVSGQVGQPIPTLVALYVHSTYNATSMAAHAHR